MKLEDSNVFVIGGISETPEAYHGAVALYDYLWQLKPELREKLIKTWIALLESTLEEGVLEELTPDNAEGSATVFISEEPIEAKRIPDNVIQFGSRNVKRI